MDVSCQVDTSGFEAACLAIASQIKGQSMQSVVEAELAKVLDQAIIYTPSASSPKIVARYKDFVPMGQDSYSPKRTRRYGTLVGSNLIYYMQNRYPNELWTRLQARRTQLVRRKQGAKGLAKKSFWEVGKRLGLPVKDGAFVKAVAVTGREYPGNYQVSKNVDANGIHIAFINGQPTVNSPAVNGRGALQRAINGRVKFFLKNVELGVFDSLDQVAKQYPGLKLTKGTP